MVLLDLLPVLPKLTRLLLALLPTAAASSTSACCLVLLACLLSALLLGGCGSAACALLLLPPALLRRAASGVCAREPQAAALSPAAAAVVAAVGVALQVPGALCLDCLPAVSCAQLLLRSKGSCLSWPYTGDASGMGDSCGDVALTFSLLLSP
jgi:hypothetical protein